MVHVVEERSSVKREMDVMSDFAVKKEFFYSLYIFLAGQQLPTSHTIISFLLFATNT